MNDLDEGGQLRFSLLGPLTASRSDVALKLGGRQQRAVLALLLVEAGAVVTTDRLVDVLWGERVPRGAIATLHTYVSRLRDLLEPGRPRGVAGAVLLTEPVGYRLRAVPSAIDAVVFAERARSGRVMFEAGRIADASAELDAALRLWQGPVLADLADYEFAQLEAARLDEVRLAALDTRVEADLILGRHADLVAELDELTAAHPVRERLHAQRMLALYRCGRQADALAGYHQLRESLANELGIDPGPAIRQLHQRVLRHDPTLDLAARRAQPLPIPPNALLGRERETQELIDLLHRKDVRLVVLTGAGGSGKTRLALEVARVVAGSFANGAVFVELAALRDPDLVLGTIAQAVGAQGLPGAPLEALAATLGAGEMLLVLDNVEHLRAVGPSLVELLGRVRNLTLLVTSRVTLRVRGEHVYPVEPLDDAIGSRLFVERAREAEPRLRIGAADRPTISQICRRLDGLPLAIELAASRVRMLTPAELLTRLGTRLPVLTDGPHDLPLRQRTLRATIEWSFDLLDKDDRRALDRLAVFAGGWTLSAAETVCDITLEDLGTFVDHSLVQRVVGEAGSRYDMLETIREHASEELNVQDSADELRRRHAAHFLAIAESANLFFEAEGPQRHEVVTTEQANIREALAWADNAGELELALNLAIALENFWATSATSEGVRWFDTLLERAVNVAPLLHARALRCHAAVLTMSGATGAGASTYEQSLAEFRALGDERGIATLLHRVADIALTRGDRGRARQLAEESLTAARASGNRKIEAQSLGTLGSLAFDDGDHERGLDLLERSASMCGAIGFWWWQGAMLQELSERGLELGRTAAADSWARDAVALLHRSGDRLNALCALAVLARIGAETGRLEEAGRLWGAVEAEEGRSPLSWWATQRDGYAAPVLAHSGAAFERGRAVGRTLPLDEAVRDVIDGRLTGAGP